MLKTMFGSGGNGPKILGVSQRQEDNDHKALDGTDVVDKSKAESGSVDNDDNKYKKSSKLLTTWLALGNFLSQKLNAESS